jgi:Alkylmercury lyase
MVQTSDTSDAVLREVRLFVFRQAAHTAKVPQPHEIAAAQLAAGKVLILAPNDGNIWAANPFCAVPSPFRVETSGKSYWGICIWDALGIVATLGADALIRAACGDCSEPMSMEIKAGRLTRSEGIIHFAVPAHHWWDNIGYT